MLPVTLVIYPHTGNFLFFHEGDESLISGVAQPPPWTGDERLVTSPSTILSLAAVT